MGARVARTPRFRPRAQDRTAPLGLGPEQDAENEREDAETFRQRGADDEVRSDRRGGVGIAADGLRRLRRRETHADPWTEHAEADGDAGGEPREIHTVATSLVISARDCSA